MRRDAPETFGLIHSLRGIAATWVLLFHASEGGHIDQLKAALPVWSRGFFDLGDNGVAIFFVLSGYVIAHSLKNRDITLSFLGKFALRRSVRLDPPLWASIAFVIAFAGLSAVVKTEPWTAPDVGQVVANATYTQIFFKYDLINPVYWTLCYEVQFYLALCLWLMLAKRATWFAYFSMLAVAIAFGSRMIVSPIDGLFVSLWHCFFLGVLAYWAHDHKTALLGFLLVWIILALSRPDTFTCFCMLTAAGLLLARKIGFMSHGLSWRVPTFLGTISYSLYLTHNPITGASFYLLAKVGLPQWASLIITLVVCVAAAFVFWLLIERPSINLAHKVKFRAVPVYGPKTRTGTLPYLAFLSGIGSSEKGEPDSAE